MNGVPFWRLAKDQLWSDADPEVSRPGLRWFQILLIAIAAAVGVLSGILGSASGAIGNVLAANAIFSALSVTMAVFYWPRAINLRRDPALIASPLRWHIYRLTTQLFWAVLIGLVGTGTAMVGMAASSVCGVSAILVSTAIGLAAYQVLLLAQSTLYLYAATYWLDRA